MRLRSLRVRRYGHFEDESIAFGGGATVVLGPNEAGKSTLLDALGDFLWGIRSHSHPRAFIYTPKFMELDGLVDVCGDTNSYTRKLKSLKDERGEEVTPPWDPELTRDADPWMGMYGLDLDRLQHGGRQVIDGKGDLADLIFLAETGQMIKKVRAELADRMHEVFKEHKNAGCSIRSCLKAIQDLDTSLVTSESSAADVTELRQKIAGVKGRRSAADEERITAERCERRLKELERCFADAAKLRELQAGLIALQQKGSVLSVSDTTALDAALEARHAALAAKETAEADIQQQQILRDELSLSPEILHAEDAIDSLHQSLEARDDDRKTIADTSSTETMRSNVADILRGLGRPPGHDLSADVNALLLADATKNRLERLAGQTQSTITKAQDQASSLLEMEKKDEAKVDESDDTELRQARVDRDAAWVAVRSPWIKGELPDPDQRLAMAESVEQAILFADKTAEQMADQLESAALHRGEETQHAKQLDAAQERLRRLQEAAGKASAEWRRVADECGLPPATDPEGWAIHDKLLTDLDTAWQKLQDHDSELEEAQKRWDEFTAEVRALDGLQAPHHTDPLLRVKALATALTKAGNAQSKADTIDAQLSTSRSKLKSAEAAFDSATASITTLLDDSDEAPEVLVEHSQKVHDKTTQIEHQTSVLQSAKDPESALDELLDELCEADPTRIKAELAEAESTRLRVGREVADLDEQIGADQKTLRDLESRDSAANIRASQITEGEKLRSLVDEYRSLRVQVALLDALIADLMKSTDSPLLENAGGFLGLLTGGRYTGFEVIEEGESRHIEVLFNGSDYDEENTTTQLATLSDGTADQVFLALRLAGICSRQDERERAGLPTLPVVLDDVLMAHDDQRTQAALQVIAELGTRIQVILLTHHGQVRDAAQSMAGITCVELAAAES